MVAQSPKLDAVFHALSDPTRRAMLRSLSAGERSISQLADPFRMFFAAASKHVKVLETAGFLRRKVAGRSHFCCINPAPLAAADQWLRYYEAFWNANLGAFESLLKAKDAAAAKKKSSQKGTAP